MADTLEIFGTEYTGVTGIIATNDNDTDLTYIRPQGTKSITQNGTGIDVASFASVDVNVSSGGQPTLQTKTKTYTPTTSQQTESVMADSGYDGLDAVNVTVNAMPMGTIADRAPINYLVAEASFDSQTGMFTAVAEIAEVINPVTQSGYVTTGAETELEADASDTYQLTMRSSSDLTASGATVTVPSGYYSAQATKSVASGSIRQNGWSETETETSISMSPNLTFIEGYFSTAPTITRTFTKQEETVTPSLSQQVVSQNNNAMLKKVTIEAIPSGTAGTPTATKGSVSNHSISVTPSVTNTTGYITGSTKTGTAVTVSASELVSGTYTVDSSGTKDVTNYASASVPAGTAGTPSASKGAVSNHSVSVTPSVTNTTGWITGSTKAGTAVTVSASELVSGTLSISDNGTSDCTNYASVNVNIPFVTYYTGTSDPASSLGSNGDIYLKVVS